MVLQWCSALQLYYIFCDANKFQRGLQHHPSTYMYECLLLIIMAVEMGVQSAEHLQIAEILCSNSLSLPTIHYPPFPVSAIPFEVFSCLSAK